MSSYVEPVQYHQFTDMSMTKTGHHIVVGGTERVNVSLIYVLYIAINFRTVVKLSGLYLSRVIPLVIEFSRLV